MNSRSVLRLLKKIEWRGVTHGMAGGHGGGQELEACPACHGAKPSPQALDQLQPEQVGHQRRCPLVAVIGDLTPKSKASPEVHERMRQLRIRKGERQDAELKTLASQIVKK